MCVRVCVRVCVKVRGARGDRRAKGHNTVIVRAGKKAPASFCSYPCQGNTSQTCGGASALNEYTFTCPYQACLPVCRLTC